jgi:hypothetical protein
MGSVVATAPLRHDPPVGHDTPPRHCGPTGHGATAIRNPVIHTRRAANALPTRD